jgi:hypothetical protein
MLRNIVIPFLLVVLALALAQSFYISLQFEKEEATMTKEILAHKDRFRNVKVIRTYNSRFEVEGTVDRQEDYNYLTNDVARLGLHRCLVQVRLYSDVTNDEQSFPPSLRHKLMPRAENE